MLRAAGLTDPLPACCSDMGARAALGTKAMSRVPMQQALGLRQLAKLWRRQATLHGEAAQIHLQRRALLGDLGHGLRQLAGKDRAGLITAEQKLR